MKNPCFKTPFWENGRVWRENSVGKRYGFGVFQGVPKKGEKYNKKNGPKKRLRKILECKMHDRMLRNRPLQSNVKFLTIIAFVLEQNAYFHKQYTELSRLGEKREK